MSSNREWLERSKAAVWHPCTQMKWHEQLPLMPIQKAQGVWLQDFEGQRYLDGVSSWWVNLFGHAHPRIVAALEDQLRQLEHVMLAGFTHEPVVRLSERLGAATGGTLGHCFYGSDGASATEMALKMSAHYWRNRGQAHRTEFIALAGGYHGETLGALGVTDVPLFREAYASLIRRCHIVPSPDARLGPQAAQSSLAALKQLLESSDAIAALIVEPLVQAAAGMVFHEPDFLKKAAALCRQYGVHLIADEIAVGFGRTGTFFAHEQAGITPDFLCLSKGITGGFLPLSVVMTRDEIFQAFYDDDISRGFLHSHSYTGNAMACRAALAVLDLFEEEEVIAGNRARGPKLETLAASLRSHPRVRNFRNRGMIWAFEVSAAPTDFSRRFHQTALARGVLLRPIGNTVYFMPPYTISDDEFHLMVDATHQSLDDVVRA
ncbi:MAG: adenosylmethionine--8-amino-7-oxononanoate transaminase [Betaproteobacteria bacterium]|nr:adenosylmethionine--8-amino-7-oxononanoate transaminase [Betaproteobacteria bacterium]